jgi:cytochrome c peroxidase
MAVGHAAAAQGASEEATPEKGAPSMLRAEARELFAALPEKMPDSENDTAARIELGRKLYFETALSSNRTQSCKAATASTRSGEAPTICPPPRVPRASSAPATPPPR